MTRAVVDFSTIDLDNCDQEPIHVPGYIQPHGVLLAFDLQGCLVHASRNAAVTLAGLPALGAAMPPPGTGSEAPLWQAVAAALSNAATGRETAPLNMEFASGGQVFDALMHAHDGRVIVELERRADVAVDLATFALLAHRSMGQLRHRQDGDTLLWEAVGTVRRLTGFDRIMAYRFHQDDSGEIVAEERQPGLEPFLHRRFRRPTSRYRRVRSMCATR